MAEDFPSPFEGCEVIAAGQLGISDYSAFTFQYSILELNTAIKSYVFLHLFKHGFDEVLYFDPDIQIFAPLTSVTDRLAAGASFVLTPHACHPVEREIIPNDLSFMRAGTYNLGFLACSRHPETLPLLRWWSRRLRYQCVVAPEEAIFVDQKFLDLLPGFAADCCILRDETCNVAYWNLAQRELTQVQGQWLINGQPLTFFHFSGVMPPNPEILSKFTVLYREPDLPSAVARILSNYLGLLARVQPGSKFERYSYARFASGTPIPDIVRRLFRQDSLSWADDPFETYEAFLHRPAIGAAHAAPGLYLSNLMAQLHREDRSLQDAFKLDANGIANYADWFIQNPLDFDLRLIQPMAAFVAESKRRIGSIITNNLEHHTDVDVVGYFDAVVGVGESGRRTVTSLTQAGFNVGTLDVAAANISQTDLVLTAPIHIFHVNADQIDYVLCQTEKLRAPGAYKIGVPFWELYEFPGEWVEAIEQMDELWVSSRFVQATLMRKLKIPVIYIPIALPEFNATEFGRDQFRLSNDDFLFLTAFDFRSYVQRKNPHGAIKAFRRAFPRQDNVRLVIKTLASEAAPKDLASLREEIGDDPRILLLNETFSQSEMFSLLNVCDCFVSLHRAEGLGQVVIEAMSLGKPVISTDYSGTTDFVRPSTGYPVDFKLIDIEDDQYLVARGRWADPDLDHAAWLMQRVYRDRAEARRRGLNAQKAVRDLFGFETVMQMQRTRLSELGLDPSGLAPTMTVDTRALVR